ncbi:hypothetical protein ACHAWF_016472 [Thalassiosira exigua]
MNPRSAFFLALLPPGTGAFRLPQPVPAPATAGGRTSPSKLRLALGDDDAAGGAVASPLPASSRRGFFSRSLSAALAAGALGAAPPLLAPSPASGASDPPLEPYDDPDYGFRVRVPSSWDVSEQKLSGRRRAVFFTDPESKDASTGSIETLGFVAYTPLRDDFTSLASFGSVDEVAQTTILPKGDLMAGQDVGYSEMFSAVSKNNAYYFDYVAAPVVPTEPGSGGSLTKTLKPQHFRTIFTLLPLKNSAGLTLVTVTLQTTEERYRDMKGVFDGVVDSFGKIPK